MSARRLGSGDAFDHLASQDVLLIDEVSVLSTVEFEQISQLRNAIIMCGLPSLPARLSTYSEACKRPLPGLADGPLYEVVPVGWTVWRPS